MAVLLTGFPSSVKRHICFSLADYKVRACHVSFFTDYKVRACLVSLWLITKWGRVLSRFGWQQIEGVSCLSLADYKVGAGLVSPWLTTKWVRVLSRFGWLQSEGVSSKYTTPQSYVCEKRIVASRVLKILYAAKRKKEKNEEQNRALAFSNTCPIIMVCLKDDKKAP